ncbi:juvenile hormone acid O-methyltransferase-like [Coccinella septempunctata]|uniref:juvenile hormone acid O-methyltransferase-like n=1 Tax=Coccinella septempunctata TaxID=41139 RepID=UPI001D065CAF|nr:juvenile hormone acid O-methyltransferase-like [Coccinella septempunctata]
MAVNPLKFYQNAVYHLDHVKTQYVNFMKSMNIPKNRPLSVLDIGLGSGRVFYEVLLPLLPKNVSEIIGSDREIEMIDFCRSMNEDPRITFEKLDITDENLPNHLQKRFDLAFSSYCFSYLRDLRHGFKNTGKLLKPDGELLNMFQYKKNGMYTTYRRLSKIEKWRPYTENYANYTTNLTGPTPEVELEKIFKDIGMTLLKYKFFPEYHMDMTKRNILEAYVSLDKVYWEVPKHQQEEYRKDFMAIFSEEVEVDFDDEATLEQVIEFNFPTVIVHARN